jgi:hypothetical protein
MAKQRFHSLPEEEFTAIVTYVMDNPDLVVEAPSHSDAVALRHKFNTWRKEIQTRFAMDLGFQSAEWKEVLDQIEVRISVNGGTTTFARRTAWLRVELEKKGIAPLPSYVLPALPSKPQGALQALGYIAPGSPLSEISEKDKDDEIKQLERALSD